jgi:ribosomal protein S27AE
MEGQYAEFVCPEPECFDSACELMCKLRPAEDVACPRCGQRTFVATHRFGTPIEPTRECPNCGWQEAALTDGRISSKGPES